MKEINKAVKFLLVVIAILLSGLFISCDSYNKLKKENAELKQLADSCFWKEYAQNADAVIDSIFNNVSDAYIEDVLIETDTWDNYYILRYEGNNNSPVKEE